MDIRKLFYTVFAVLITVYAFGIFGDHARLFYIVPYSKLTDTVHVKYKDLNFYIPKKEIDYRHGFAFMNDVADGRSTINMSISMESIEYPLDVTLINNDGYCLRYGCEYGGVYQAFFLEVDHVSGNKPNCPRKYSFDNVTGLNQITNQSVSSTNRPSKNVYFDGDPCNPSYYVACKHKDSQKLYHCESTLSFYDSVQIKYRFGIEHFTKHREIRDLIEQRFLSYSDDQNASPYKDKETALLHLTKKNMRMPKGFKYNIQHENVRSVNWRYGGVWLAINSPAKENGELIWGELTGELEELNRFENHGQSPLHIRFKERGKDPLYDRFQERLHSVSTNPSWLNEEICLDQSKAIYDDLSHSKLCKKPISGKGLERCIDFYFQGDPCRPDYYMACDYLGKEFKDCNANTYFGNKFLFTYYIKEIHIEDQMKVLETWWQHIKEMRRKRKSNRT
jgi:hypothetical protein